MSLKKDSLMKKGDSVFTAQNISITYTKLKAFSKFFFFLEIWLFVSVIYVCVLLFEW